MKTRVWLSLSVAGAVKVSVAIKISLERPLRITNRAQSIDAIAGGKEAARSLERLPNLPHPDDAIVDKITMSAFEGTFLEIALRDFGIRSFIIAGIALEIGIDPTCRQGADLGFWPILVRDACGFGDEQAANHSLASLQHMGDTTITDVDTVCMLLAYRVAKAS
ncbi:MAG: cysteine hydrolase family protein [Candidatus Sulfotelmatobacter sp.]